ncbi:MAG: FAD-dependent oxidoreductase [Leptospiraceae bacterium]|nr:FAD-dependent oxidoreductase [Leptospiraceae bacterium]
MAEARVVIVGGGFAGLNAAKHLGNKEGVHVTLIDRRNHHLFQPLLYQVALAALSPADIATPIRSVLSDYENVDVLLGNVRTVDFQHKKVTAGFGAVPYDYLILACGANHSYFGRDDWEEYAPGLKSLEEATEIRRRVLMAYEMAERTHDRELQKEYLTFVIVGGGPTGVEMAGAIGEMSRYTLGRDFRNLDPRNTRIILVEGASRILNAFDSELSMKAARGLEKLGVTIWTNSRVTDITPYGVKIGEETVRACTVLWAAGVRPAELSHRLGVPLDSAGRVSVEGDLSIPGHPDVFVLGDQAHFEHNTPDGNALPGLAPVAIQMGRHVARNILREVRGQSREPFQYRDKGIMATIGRADAIVQVGKIRFGGMFAWLTWLFVHIMYLVGFKNRMLVMIQWFWSYVTLSRGARLVTSRNWKSEKRFELAYRYINTFEAASKAAREKNAGKNGTKQTTRAKKTAKVMRKSAVRKKGLRKTAARAKAVRKKALRKKK